MIVAFQGQAGSGKDTAAEHLSKEYGFKRISFADPLRSVCKTVFGLTNDELFDRQLKERELDRWPYISPRQILQMVGTEMFRTHFPGVWINAFMKIARQHSNVVVADLRFPDEAEAVKNLGGVIIRVRALNSPYQTRFASHLSETGAESLPYDSEITNNFYADNGKHHLFDALDLIMDKLHIPRCPHCTSKWLPDAIR